MIATHETVENKFGIIGMTPEEAMELSNMIDMCPLPQKRDFYGIKRDLDILLSKATQPKKKNA